MHRDDDGGPIMSDYPLSNISADSLRNAAAIQDQIETLGAQLRAILTGEAPAKRAYKKRGPKPGSKRTATTTTAAKRKGGSRKISPEGRERIRQAQLKRWAMQKKK